jgi:hypothetical protein
MAALVHCIYASNETHRFEPPELIELLQKARANNAGLGITGMLLYSEGSFFQVLEGAPEVVEALFGAIGRDERHEKVTRIIFEPIPKRHFGEWTMGFASVTREELERLAGANDFFAGGQCLADLDAGRSKKLLEAFRKGRWRDRLAIVPKA